MRRRQRQQVEPEEEFHAGNRRRMLDSAMMTGEDTEQLRSKLRAVRDAKLNAWTVSPELATLLCLPPDEGPHSRMLELLNQIVLISALILSATLGIGMDPKDVAQVPDGMKTIADVWNFLASFTVVLNMLTCVFGAYFAMELCSVSNTEMSRVLAHSSGIRSEFFSHVRPIVFARPPYSCHKSKCCAPAVPRQYRQSGTCAL